MFSLKICCSITKLPVPNPSEFTVFLCPEYIDLVYKDVLSLPDIVEGLHQLPLILLPDPQELPLLPPLLAPPLPPPRPPPPPPLPRH